VSAKDIQAQPILRWAGSKKKLLPVLIELAPKQFDRYVEPFAGSACLFFSLQPKLALLGDINKELINTYRQIKRHANKLITALSDMPERSAENFYAVRTTNPDELDSVQRAARFIYLNRFCFNGLYRTNMQGKFNVPFGGIRTGDLPTSLELKSVAKAFQSVSFKSASFETVLSQVKEGDFVYLDPPYSISNRRVFNNYSSDVFGIQNLQILKSELNRLDGEGIPFLLSYGLSKEGLELAKGFRARHALVQRQISGFSANRRKARELLVTNY